MQGESCADVLCRAAFALHMEASVVVDGCIGRKVRIHVLAGLTAGLGSARYTASFSPSYCSHATVAALEFTSIHRSLPRIIGLLYGAPTYTFQ
jgi:hypothetical protein